MWCRDCELQATRPEEKAKVPRSTMKLRGAPGLEHVPMSPWGKRAALSEGKPPVSIWVGPPATTRGENGRVRPLGIAAGDGPGNPRQPQRVRAMGRAIRFSRTRADVVKGVGVSMTPHEMEPAAAGEGTAEPGSGARRPPRGILTWPA